MLQTMHIFTPEGGIGASGLVISAASATLGTSMNVMKGLAKPAASTATGTAGHLSAPVYTTLENLASILLLTLAYGLIQINPWLLVGLVALIFASIVTFLIFAIVQMVRLKKGISRVLELTHTTPRAGLAVITECLVWGVGWFAWKGWARGTVMLLVWLVFISIGIAIQPGVLGIGLIFTPFPIMVLFFGLMVYFSIGLGSARDLLKYLEKQNIV